MDKLDPSDGIPENQLTTPGNWFMPFGEAVLIARARSRLAAQNGQDILPLNHSVEPVMNEKCIRCCNGQADGKALDSKTLVIGFRDGRCLDCVCCEN